MQLDKDNRMWMGKLPEDWKTRKIKYILWQRNEDNVPVKSTDILSLTAKQGVIPYKDKKGGGNKPKQNLSAYKLAYPGDIVMNSMNILSGAVGLSKYMGCVSPVYYMFRPISKKDDVRFFYYVFANKAFQQSLLGIGNGILIKKSNTGTYNTIRMRIPIEKLKNLAIPYPSTYQQKKIADFLDKKCEKIDKLSTQIQQEIISLRKYRKNIIAKTLTKGLDSNVSIKETGIKWIGKIPKNWKISKIKYEADYIGSGSTPNSSNYELYDGNVFWIQSGDLYRKRTITNTQVKVTEKAIKTTSSLKIIKKDFIVIAMYGGSIGNISMSKISACTNQAVCAIKPNKNNDIKFLYYWLSFCKDDFFRKASGGTQPNINQIIIKNEFIPRIPLIEQEKIVNYLDNEVNLIEKIISHKQRQQQLLKKYKHSLIYDFVTGKKQVPSVGEE